MDYLDEEVVGSDAIPGHKYIELPRAPSKWVLSELVPLQGMTNLYGKPKAGKSYGALGWAEAISNPKMDHWNGFRVFNHGPVFYLQVDTPRPFWQERVDKLAHAGMDLSNVHFADRWIAPHGFNILEPSHAAWLTRQLQRVQPVVCFIDVLAEIHRGEENSNDHMKAVVQGVVDAAGPVAVVFVSHDKKGSGDGETGFNVDIADGNRGASYVSGRMDCIVRLTRQSLEIRSRDSERKIYLKRTEVGTHHREAQKDSVVDELIDQVVTAWPEYTTDQVLAIVKPMVIGKPEATLRGRIDSIREDYGE